MRKVVCMKSKIAIALLLAALAQREVFAAYQLLGNITEECLSDPSGIPFGTGSFTALVPKANEGYYKNADYATASKLEFHGLEITFVGYAAGSSIDPILNISSAQAHSQELIAVPEASQIAYFSAATGKSMKIDVCYFRKGIQSPDRALAIRVSELDAAPRKIEISSCRKLFVPDATYALTRPASKFGSVSHLPRETSPKWGFDGNYLYAFMDSEYEDYGDAEAVWRQRGWNSQFGPSNCFRVYSPNITLECQSNIVSGSSKEFIATTWWGVHSDQNGTVVKNCDINGFRNGISYWNANGGRIINNSVHFGSENDPTEHLQWDKKTSITLDSSHNNLIAGNLMELDDGMEGGIKLSASTGNVVEGNRVKSVAPAYAGVGIVNGSDGNKLIGNRLEGEDGAGLSIEGSSDNYAANNTILSGIIPETTYYEGQPYQKAGTSALDITEGNRNTIAYNDVHSAGPAFSLFNSSENSLRNNSFVSANGGILNLYSSKNTLTGNSISANYAYSDAMVVSSDNNLFVENRFYSEHNAGIRLSYAPYFALAGKFLDDGSVLSSDLVVHQAGTNNTFYKNTVTAPVWVADEDEQTENFLDLDGQGNSYYFANGTPAWEACEIYDTDGDGYADSGADLPFSNKTLGEVWLGHAQDWHPYTTRKAFLAEVQYPQEEKNFGPPRGAEENPAPANATTEETRQNGFAQEFSLDLQAHPAKPASAGSPICAAPLIALFVSLACAYGRGQKGISIKKVE